MQQAWHLNGKAAGGSMAFAVPGSGCRIENAIELALEKYAQANAVCARHCYKENF